MKNCLATLGMLFLLIVSASAILLAPLYIDEIYEIASEFGFPVNLNEPGEVIVGVVSAPENQILPTPGSSLEIKNLVEIAPLPTPTAVPTPIPEPTPTPIPDPVEYRTRVEIRARHFSTALNMFMDTSRKLDEDANLLGDPYWRSEIYTALDEFVFAAGAMGSVSPVPPEYQAVDEWLDRAGSEAQHLRDHYKAGVESGNRQYFEAVGKSMDQIFEYMAQVQYAMIASGWGQ